MAGFKTNMAAMNAARKQFGKDWKSACRLEKLDGEWYVQINEIPPAELPPVIPGWDKIEGGAMTAEQHDAQSAALIAAAATASETLGDDACEEFAEAQRQADKIANAQASEEQLPNGKVWVKMSSVAKPTKLVWAIADEMMGMAENEAEQSGKPVQYPTRGEVQAECVRRGIASGTARTQYQAWKTSRDNDAKNAANAAELSRKFNGN